MAGNGWKWLEIAGIPKLLFTWHFYSFYVCKFDIKIKGESAVPGPNYLGSCCDARMQQWLYSSPFTLYNRFTRFFTSLMDSLSTFSSTLTNYPRLPLQCSDCTLQGPNRFPISWRRGHLDTALHCTALHCTALHCTALHCTALHCTALHCTALHCNKPNTAL